MNNRKVISGLAWRFAERCGAQGVSFVVSIILARLLVPEDYGLIAIVSIFTTILNVFVDNGLASSLIQKKDADDLDFSSVFYCNVAFCFVLYVLLFASAPFIAQIYNNPQLVPLVRVMGLSLVISGLKNVQQAYISKTMQFKKFFFATLGGTIAAAVLGITLAYLGFGVWALVIQSLLNNMIDTIILWSMVKWRPKFLFSFTRLKILLSYGSKLLFSSLLDTVYTEIRQLIIGVMYSATDLAFYNKGTQFPNLVIKNVNASIDSVLFPVLSNEQDNVSRVKNMTRRAMKMSTYIMAPLMMGMAFIATPLIRLVLTEKWLPCVFFMRIFCITFMFYPIHTANLNAIKALGKSDTFLKLEVEKKVVGILIVLATMWISVEAMAWGMLLGSFFSQIINSHPNKKLLNYGYLEQLSDILPSILLAVFMGICVYPIQFIGLPDIVTICIQVLLGCTIYIIGSMILKIESFNYIWNLIKTATIKKVNVD